MRNIHKGLVLCHMLVVLFGVGCGGTVDDPSGGWFSDPYGGSPAPSR